MSNARKTTKPDAARVWKQMEDVVIRRFRISTVDRAVYSNLLRHSYLEGRRALLFSIAWLARGTGLSEKVTRHAVRRLQELGALRLMGRGRAGHVVEVHLPKDFRVAAGHGAAITGEDEMDRGLEEMNFMESGQGRKAIQARERGRCFYCMRRVGEGEETLDHVVAQVNGGGHSYRNLVLCCADCNCCKGEVDAGDYLRVLYREGRLTASELSERLTAVEALAEGRLRPVVETKLEEGNSKSESRKPGSGSV